MSKHEIDIEVIPEGWKPVAYRVPVKDDNYHTYGDEVLLCKSSHCAPFLIVEKIQPRRIVLDITQEEYALLLKIPIEQMMFDNPVMFDLLQKIQSAKVNETNSPDHLYKERNED